MKRVVYLMLLSVLIVGCGSKNQAGNKTEEASPSPGTDQMMTAYKTSGPKSPELENKKRQLLKAGMLYLSKAQVTEAIKTFSEVVKMDPADQQAYFILAQTYIRLKKYDNAVTILDSVIRMDGHNGQAYYLKGVASTLAGNRTDALEALQRSVKIFQEKRDEANFKRAVALLQGLTSGGKEPSAAGKMVRVNGDQDVASALPATENTDNAQMDDIGHIETNSK